MRRMIGAWRSLFLVSTTVIAASAQTIHAFAGANWVFPPTPLPALQAPNGFH
jgi:hypothetical protein